MPYLIVCPRPRDRWLCPSIRSIESHCPSYNATMPTRYNAIPTRQLHKGLERLPHPDPNCRRWPTAPVQSLPGFQFCLYTVRSVGVVQGECADPLSRQAMSLNGGREQSYEVYTDPYHNVMRLDLFKFDGSPMNPMYLAFKPPQMLPTQTLNPTATATAGARASGKSKSKRGLEDGPLPLNRHVIKPRTQIDADKWWWVGVGVTALGAVGYLCF